MTTSRKIFLVNGEVALAPRNKEQEKCLKYAAEYYSDRIDVLEIKVPEDLTELSNILENELVHLWFEKLGDNLIAEDTKYDTKTLL